VDKGCHRDVEETLGVPRQEKSRGDEEFAKGGIEPGARCFSSWQGENWRGGGVWLGRLASGHVVRREGVWLSASAQEQWCWAAAMCRIVERCNRGTHIKTGPVGVAVMGRLFCAGPK
jgi:hypothetical protein